MDCFCWLLYDFFIAICSRLESSPFTEFPSLRAPTSRYNDDQLFWEKWDRKGHHLWTNPRGFRKGGTLSCCRQKQIKGWHSRFLSPVHTPHIHQLVKQKCPFLSFATFALKGCKNNQSYKNLLEWCPNIRISFRYAFTQNTVI